jgi:hypothetical protein
MQVKSFLLFNRRIVFDFEILVDFSASGIDLYISPSI